MIYITLLVIIPFFSSIIAFLFEWIEREASFISVIVSSYVSFMLYNKYKYVPSFSLYYFVLKRDLLLFLFFANLFFALLIIYSFRFLRKSPFSNRYYFNVLLLNMLLNFLYISNINLVSLFLPLVGVIITFSCGWKGRKFFLLKNLFAWIFLVMGFFLPVSPFLKELLFAVYVVSSFLPLTFNFRDNNPFLHGFLSFYNLFITIYWLKFFNFNNPEILFYSVFLTSIIIIMMLIFRDKKIWMLFDINYSIFYIIVLIFSLKPSEIAVVTGAGIYLVSLFMIIFYIYYRHYTDDIRRIPDMLVLNPYPLLSILLISIYVLPFPGTVLPVYKGIRDYKFFILFFVHSSVVIFTLFSLFKENGSVVKKRKTPFLVISLFISLGVISFINGINILWGKLNIYGFFPLFIVFFYIGVMKLIRKGERMRIVKKK